MNKTLTYKYSKTSKKYNLNYTPVLKTYYHSMNPSSIYRSISISN